VLQVNTHIKKAYWEANATPILNQDLGTQRRLNDKMFMMNQ